MKPLHYVPVRAIFFLCLIALLAVFNISALAQKAANPTEQTTTSVRPDADSVLLTVTITDKKGVYVSGLDKSAFVVYDNKTPQEISFFSAQDEPASIGILFDLSGSVPSNAREIIRDSLLRFIKLNHSEDEYFLIGFDSHPQLLVDWISDSKVVQEGLSKLNISPEKGGGTTLYDALYLGLEKMKTAAHAKRVMLLISDGEENESKHKLKEVRELLKAEPVTLYSVHLHFETDVILINGEEIRTVMIELPCLTGGMTVFPVRKKDVDDFFDRVTTEIRHQYLLGFKPSGVNADGKWHQIKVKVTVPVTTSPLPNLTVRSREGYSAVKNQP